MNSIILALALTGIGVEQKPMQKTAVQKTAVQKTAVQKTAVQKNSPIQKRVRAHRVRPVRRVFRIFIYRECNASRCK